jgi:hypothetical protein
MVGTRAVEQLRGGRGAATEKSWLRPFACLTLIVVVALVGVTMTATRSGGSEGPNWTGLWKVILTCSRPICPVDGYFDLVQSGNTVTGQLNGMITLTSGTASGRTAVLAYHYGVATTEFYRLTMSSDGETFTGPVTTVTSDGDTHDIGLLTGTRSNENTLSVSDVTRGTDALSVDVKVILKSALAVGSDCDPKVTYDFADADLDSAKKIAPCQYRLTFNPPGTGIYHVGLKATNESGTITPVTVDQYGDTVDGKFTLIIDSCADPDQSVADIDSLLNADDDQCDLVVGDWDTDTADLTSEVIADVDSQPSLAITPIPSAAVDPSDWPSKGPVGDGATGGWVPTGTNRPPLEKAGSFATGINKAIAWVSKVNLPGVPTTWAGANDHRPVNIEEVPPATVISAHGLWFTSNGLIHVPSGDTIETYVPLGTAMESTLGLDIDTGNVHGDDKKYLHVYKSGQLVPDFTFMHYGDTPAKHVTTVTDPTTLNQLVTPDEGIIWISACAPIMIPEGGTLEKALAGIPIRGPGVKDPIIGFANVAITSDGQLQVLSGG